ncbi:hypothetical protein EV714DRAFT_217779 [Schizophyllum commune]
MMSANSKLPELELVRAEASRVQDFIRNPRDPNCVAILGSHVKMMQINLALTYSLDFPNLVKYAIHCNPDKVPKDILHECIWAGERFIWGVEASSVEQLRFAGVLPSDGNQGHRLLLVRGKNVCPALAFLCITHTVFCTDAGDPLPEIDRPVEALEHYRAFLRTNDRYLGVTEDPWAKDPSVSRLAEHLTLSNPTHHSIGLFLYAIVLARARTADAEAVAILTRAIGPESGLVSSQVAQCKVYLARVLRRLGEDPRSRATLSSIRWFKKNPHAVQDQALMQLFTVDINPETDPVLQGLGGPKWLESRRRTAKTQQRIVRLCRHCSKMEPQVKLMLCSRCQYYFYCSRECQKAHYPYHKRKAEYLKRVAELKASGHKLDARLAERFTNFCNTPGNPSHSILLASALGLQRDQTRSRTHIVFRAVEYQPRAKDPFDYFRYTHVGVYKIEDVYTEIERLLRLDRGEGHQYIEGMLEEFDNGPGKTMENGVSTHPILTLTFDPVHDTRERRLGCSACRPGSMIPYDPDWRKKMNRTGESPGTLDKYLTRVRDVEHIF